MILPGVMPPSPQPQNPMMRRGPSDPTQPQQPNGPTDMFIAASASPGGGGSIGGPGPAPPSGMPGVNVGAMPPPPIPPAQKQPEAGQNPVPITGPNMTHMAIGPAQPITGSPGASSGSWWGGGSNGPPSGPTFPSPAPNLPNNPNIRPASPDNPYAPSSGGWFQGSANPNQLSGFNQFADAAYREAERRLNPQFDSMENRFRQQMVNRGLAEGTEAYNNAWDNFSRDRNDAYSSARNQALAQALAAQGQAFGQSFQNAQLGQNQDQFGRNLGFQYAGLNEQNRQFDTGLGEQFRQFNANLGQRESEFGRNLGQNWWQFGSNLAQRESEFGRNFGFQNQQADFANLMNLLGYGQQTTAYNNNLLNSDFNRAGGLFGLIPGMMPTQVDVLGPYQMQQNAAMQQAQMQQGANNGLWGAVGQLGSAALPFMFSDIRLKADIQRVGELDNGLPVYLYRYADRPGYQIGLMAQDVEQVNPGAVVEIDGYKAVNYAEAVK